MLSWRVLPALRAFAIKCPTRHLLLHVRLYFFNVSCISPKVLSLGKRTVHSIVGSALFPVPPTVGNLYPRFRGTALQGCGHGENDPIRAEWGQDLPALCQFGQRFRAPGATGCNPSRQYSPCSPSAPALLGTEGR